MATPRASGRAPRPSRRTMKNLLKPVGLDGPETVELPPVLGLTEAAGLRDRLLSVRGRMIDLDGSKVERLGGLGLQILLSAYSTWGRDGQRLRLLQPSDALRDGLALFGARHFNTSTQEQTT